MVCERCREEAVCSGPTPLEVDSADADPCALNLPTPLETDSAGAGSGGSCGVLIGIQRLPQRSFLFFPFLFFLPLPQAPAAFAFGLAFCLPCEQDDAP